MNVDVVKVNVVELVDVELVVHVIGFSNQESVNPEFSEMSNGLCSLHAGHASSTHGPLIHSLRIFQISVVNKVAVVKVVEEVVVNLDNELLVDDGTCKW